MSKLSIDYSNWGKLELSAEGRRLESTARELERERGKVDELRREHMRLDEESRRAEEHEKRVRHHRIEEGRLQRRLERKAWDLLRVEEGRRRRAQCETAERPDRREEQERSGQLQEQAQKQRGTDEQARADEEELRQKRSGQEVERRQNRADRWLRMAEEGSQFERDSGMWAEKRTPAWARHRGKVESSLPPLSILNTHRPGTQEGNLVELPQPDLESSPLRSGRRCKFAA